MRRPFLLLALSTAAPATAQTPAPAVAPAPLPPATAPIPSDGRLFGHFPYADIGSTGLVSAPAGFAIGQSCRVQPAVADALALLLAAKAAAGVPGTLHGLSCYRSIAHQRSVFCRAGKNCRDAAARSRTVAPPGYSEHETGYAIDFAVRPAPGCPDTSDCIARTPAGAWLLANAARFGFELSFPSGNAQGVTWEPWHWRWVGVIGEAPGARPARVLFGTARTRFPAAPAVLSPAIRVAEQPPITLGVLGTPTPPPPVKLPKEKRRRR
jgi:D-alanyl-D-alanine carboxypeptidase